MRINATHCIVMNYPRTYTSMNHVFDAYNIVKTETTEGQAEKFKGINDFFQVRVGFYYWD